MTRTYFGTDGIRGEANQHPMTAAMALKVGMAAGHVFNRGAHRHKVVIAKDTRLSGYLLEPALTAGFIAVGMDVLLVGPMPTPAVAMLTRSMRADLGVMISASHNAFQDNGIKLFGPDGYKLSDETEAEIEQWIDREAEIPLAASRALGRAKRIDDAPGRYIEFVKQTLPRRIRLDGLKIVLDCAHGAAYQVGPVILRELGAEVITLGTAPDGFNINDGCGSTSTKAMGEAVRRHRAAAGIALDGDADRVVMCDETGKTIDGDQMLAVAAESWAAQGRLKGGSIVTTLMSNLGLERFLQSKGIGMLRASVGDRYVLEMMRANGINLGGEQSGHIVFSDYTTTGDGLIAALQALAVMVEEGKLMSECSRRFEPLPQILKNVPYSEVNPLDNKTVQEAIIEAQEALRGKGRLVIRKSGTEPLVRIMIEAEEQAMVDKLSSELAGCMERAIEAA